MELLLQDNLNKKRKGLTLSFFCFLDKISVENKQKKYYN